MVSRIVPGILGVTVLLMSITSGGEPNVERLITELRDNREEVRIQAIDQLGRLGSQAAPAVPALETLLRDDSAMVRAHAAGSLGAIGSAAETAVPSLIRSVGDPEPAVRRKAIEALGRLRPDPQLTVQPFVRLMEDADPSVRLRALDALAEHGAAAVPALVELLEKDQAAYWACLVLNQIGPDAESAVPALTERISDPRPEVRREAILALAEIGEAAAAATDAIAAVLDDDTTRLAATYALGRLGRIPPEAGSRIREHAHSRDPLLRTTSVWTLARIYPEDTELQKEAIDQLATSLKSDELQVRATAARALASMDPDPEIAAPILEDALRDADEETIQYALDAVAGLGPVMIPQLTRALQFETLRPRVAFVLGEMGPDAEPAVEALVELIDAPSRQTQREALLALAKIGPAAEVAVPALIKALEQHESTCRYGTVYALGQIGSAAEPAKPALLKLTESDDDTLALLSAWALAQIAPECRECAAKTVPLLVEALAHPDARHRREAAAALGAMGPLAQPAGKALERAAEDPDIGVRTAATAALTAIDR